MSHDTATRRFGGSDFVPPVDQRTAPPRPQSRPVPDYPVYADTAPAGYDAAAGTSAPPPPPPQVAEDGVVHLSRGYRAHDLDDVRRIKLRRPTTADLRKCGYPMRTMLDHSGRPCAVEELPDVIGRYVALLSDPPLPQSTVNELTLEDFSRLSTCVVGFFMDG